MLVVLLHVIVKLHHGELIDLLEQVVLGEGVNSVAEGIVHDFLEICVLAVQQHREFTKQLVSELGIILLARFPDILVPSPLKVFEVLCILLQSLGVVS